MKEYSKKTKTNPARRSLTGKGLNKPLQAQSYKPTATGHPEKSCNEKKNRIRPDYPATSKQVLKIFRVTVWTM